MIVTPLIRKSASLAYAGIRLPFSVVESRLPERSGIRTGLHAVLQTVDSSLQQRLQPSSAESVADARAQAVPSDDDDAEREAIAEAVRERQPDVGELADPDLDVAEVQAQLQAKHAIETREEARQAPDGTGSASGGP